MQSCGGKERFVIKEWSGLFNFYRNLDRAPTARQRGYKDVEIATKLLAEMIAFSVDNGV